MAALYANRKTSPCSSPTCFGLSFPGIVEGRPVHPGLALPAAGVPGNLPGAPVGLPPLLPQEWPQSVLDQTTPNPRVQRVRSTLLDPGKEY